MKSRFSIIPRKNGLGKLNLPKTILKMSSFYIIVISISFPAMADRHCLPALEAFFGARYALQDETLGCSAALKEAVDALGSAHDHASACGCSELTSAMSMLIDEAADEAKNCEVRRAVVLDNTEEVRALVSACH